MSVPKNPRDIPVNRVSSGENTPHPYHPNGTRIVADHGLHVWNEDGELEWLTLLTLYVDGGRVAQLRAHDTDGPEAVDNGVRALQDWAAALADLAAVHALEEELPPLERAFDDALHGNTAGVLLGADTALQAARAAYHVRRAAMLARVLWTRTPDRSGLEGVTVFQFNPARPEPEARAEISRHELDAWRETHGRRDAVVVEGWDAMVSKVEIHERTGLARTTVDRILEA